MDGEAAAEAATDEESGHEADSPADFKCNWRPSASQRSASSPRPTKFKARTYSRTAPVFGNVPGSIDCCSNREITCWASDRLLMPRSCKRSGDGDERRKRKLPTFAVPANCRKQNPENAIIQVLAFLSWYLLLGDVSKKLARNTVSVNKILCFIKF